MALKRDPIAFPKLDDGQVSALGKFATLKSFARGETLFAAGERDFKFFVVKSGEVAIVDRSSGQDEIVTIHEPREFTGDVDMLTGRAVLVSAIAMSDNSAGQAAVFLSERARKVLMLILAIILERTCRITWQGASSRLPPSKCGATPRSAKWTAASRSLPWC